MSILEASQVLGCVSIGSMRRCGWGIGTTAAEIAGMRIYSQMR